MGCVSRCWRFLAEGTALMLAPPPHGGMDSDFVTGDALRGARLRLARRGYSIEDVDRLLAMAAATVDHLLAALAEARQANSSAQQPGSDDGLYDGETVARALVLAEQAAHQVVAGAQDQAERLLVTARERAALEAEAERERTRAELDVALAELAEARQEADRLRDWAGPRKARLLAALAEAAAVLENAEVD